jgi:hypothetical protein
MSTSYTVDKSAHEKLADLMSREMDVQVNPKVLRMFIRAHWSKVSLLSHAIHEQRADE